MELDIRYMEHNIRYMEHDIRYIEHDIRYMEHDIRYMEHDILHIVSTFHLFTNLLKFWRGTWKNYLHVLTWNLRFKV